MWARKISKDLRPTRATAPTSGVRASSAATARVATVPARQPRTPSATVSTVRPSPPVVGVAASVPRPTHSHTVTPTTAATAHGTEAPGSGGMPGLGDDAPDQEGQEQRPPAGEGVQRVVAPDREREQPRKDEHQTVPRTGLRHGWVTAATTVTAISHGRNQSWPSGIQILAMSPTVTGVFATEEAAIRTVPWMTVHSR